MPGVQPAIRCDQAHGRQPLSLPLRRDRRRQATERARGERRALFVVRRRAATTNRTAAPIASPASPCTSAISTPFARTAWPASATGRSFCHHCGTGLVADLDAGGETDLDCPACRDGHHLVSRQVGTEKLAVLECGSCGGSGSGTTPSASCSNGHTRDLRAGGARGEPSRGRGQVRTAERLGRSARRAGAVVLPSLPRLRRADESP